MKRCVPPRVSLNVFTAGLGLVMAPVRTTDELLRSHKHVVANAKHFMVSHTGLLGAVNRNLDVLDELLSKELNNQKKRV